MVRAGGSDSSEGVVLKKPGNCDRSLSVTEVEEYEICREEIMDFLVLRVFISSMTVQPIASHNHFEITIQLSLN